MMHGGHDVLTVSQAQKVYEYGKAKGVDVTLRLLSEEETGAEHCQHDNPTIGQEILADWLADRFGIDQSVLLTTSHTWFEHCWAPYLSRFSKSSARCAGVGRLFPAPVQPLLARRRTTI